MRNPQFTAEPSRLAKSFHVSVKPIGARCNLDCTYCYYLHKQDMLSDTKADRMSDGLLEEFIHQYIAQQDVHTIIFTWHGGEPTMLGLDFFQKVVELQRKHSRQKHIENDLQTNGLLIDDAWCQFLRDNHFYVGLSIDGPKYLHDLFRISKNGGSSFDKASRAACLFKKYNIPFNTLTVVNAVNAQHPVEVYRFLTEELGSRRLQLLACVEPKEYQSTAPCNWDSDKMPILGTDASRPGHPDSVVTDWSVDPDNWGDFLCQIFNLWMEKDIGNVTVNWFESLIGQWMRQPPQICVLAEVCGRSLAIEKDGSIYSCDHFVYPEFKLGNLNDRNQRLSDFVYSAQQRRFGCQKSDNLPNYCKQCVYRFACNGGCPKDRFIKSPDGQLGLNYLCSGIKRFLTHADPFIRQIVAGVQHSHNASNLL